jgi:short-subunit dehydrogenase
MVASLQCPHWQDWWVCPDAPPTAPVNLPCLDFLRPLRSEVKDAGVSVTIAYPGVVATNIRVNGLNAQGQNAGVSGLVEDSAMPVKDCARLIIYAMVRRRREVVMTAQGKVGRWLKLIAPWLVDQMAMKAVKKEFRPSSH